MKSDYVTLWYTQFRKLRASKGSDLLLCNDTEFDLLLVILNTLHWQLPFHSTLITRRPYLGHDNWRLRYSFFPFKVPLTFRHSWKRLRKRRSKNLIKFPQVYIAFALQYARYFEKNNIYWLIESWETRLPKRLKCTIVAVSSIVSQGDLSRAIKQRADIRIYAKTYKPRRDGSMVCVSASHAVVRGFASGSGHTEEHHRNGANCLLA